MQVEAYLYMKLYIIHKYTNTSMHMTRCVVGDWWKDCFQHGLLANEKGKTSPSLFLAFALWLHLGITPFSKDDVSY